MFSSRGTVFASVTLFIMLLECADVHGRALSSEFMTLEDAEYYTGASSSPKSPPQEFEIVSPWEVETARKRREADNPFDISEFKFGAFGEEFHLQLTTNQRLTKRGLKVEYVDENGHVEERPLPSEHENCYKFGRVLSHEGASRVAVSTCNDGLSGIVKLEGYELFIQKLTDNHTESVRRKRSDLVNPHIVYRRSTSEDGDDGEHDHDDDMEKDNSTEHFCALETYYHYLESNFDMNMDTPVGEQEEEEEEIMMEGAGQSRRKRALTCPSGVPLGTKTMELFLVIDATMSQYHSSRGRSATDYALTLLNTVASSYMHESLGIPLVIKIVKMRVLTSDTVSFGSGTLRVTPDGSDTLQSFCTYQRFENNLDENSPDHYDNALMLTRYNLELQSNQNLLGIAQFNGACNRFASCALVEESGFGAGIVITHEIGHNLGMEHDGDSRFSDAAANCEDGVNIMSSFRTSGLGSFVWSSCSQVQLNTFLCSPSKTCLNDNSPNFDPTPLNPSDMPGDRFTGDQQCGLIHSGAAAVCTRHRDICGHLACMFPDGRCIGTGVAALDGTTCGNNMWCSSGICVDRQTGGNPSQNGGWSTWSAFSSCSVTCGQGQQSRTRQCNNPVPQNGGLPCPGNDRETTTCFTQACPTVVNGGWSAWQNEPCSKSCGGGIQLRRRTCNNPPPQNGGLPCSGSDRETITCFLQACPTVVNGGWSAWQNEPCSKSCGGGQQLRLRTCNNPLPQNGGANCPGNSAEFINCNTQTCPIIGGWSEWQTGSCSSSCGGGQQIRQRICNNPTPQNGGANCPGQSVEVVSCNTQACVNVVNGGWSEWQNGPCSRSCGGGQQTRTRTCNNPTAENGGAQCQGKSQEVVSCNAQACSVDGGWSPWSPFIACSVTCGSGQRTRTRICDNPPPQNDGQTCFGPGIQFEICNNQPCLILVNGGWSAWGPFGTCSVSCGGGLQTQTRTCDNPAPQNGGQYCSGPAENSQACNTQSCHVIPDGQTVSGVFTTGQYGEFVQFLTIPTGATNVVITNTNPITNMAIKVGSMFLVGESNNNYLPARVTTTVDHRGTSITHDYFTNNQIEKINIDGPTTVELVALVRVFLNPIIFGASQVYPNIEWSYMHNVPSEWEWVRTEGECSTTCGSGFSTEVIRCARSSNAQEIAGDESACSHLDKPSSFTRTCNAADCPQARWFSGLVNCSGLCGQASGRRPVFCILAFSPENWSLVDDSQCAGQPKPAETEPCANLPDCRARGCDNALVTAEEGSANRMTSTTGGEVCTYTIVAPPDKDILVNIIDHEFDCDKGEFLKIRDGNNEPINFCTSDRSLTAVYSNVVQIEHKTLISGHGYDISYRFIAKSGQSSDCDEVFLEDSGIIQSPSYPANYDNNKLCKKYIVAPADKKIVINFNKLTLFPRCWRYNRFYYDYITIKDFDLTFYRWYCGTFSNPTEHIYESTSNRVLFTFRSNYIDNAQGFEAVYSFVPRD